MLCFLARGNEKTLGWEATPFWSVGEQRCQTCTLGWGWQVCGEAAAAFFLLVRLLEAYVKYPFLCSLTHAPWTEIPPKGWYGKISFRNLPLGVSQCISVYSKQKSTSRGTWLIQSFQYVSGQRIKLCGYIRNIIKIQRNRCSSLMKDAVSNSLMQHFSTWCWGRITFWKS